MHSAVSTDVGGVTSVVNTQFNNVYYDESTNLNSSFLWGAGFGALGPVSGRIVGSFADAVLPNVPRIPISGAVSPFAAQGSLNPWPSQLGNTVSNLVGAGPAFVELDNGSNKPVIQTGETK